MIEPTRTNNIHGGEQRLYFFPNGYGASVVRHSFSYGGNCGLWELAVIVGDADSWSLNYDTSITDDVIGDLSEEEIQGLLEEIQALPSTKGVAI
jgi:hypothetical protein